MKRTDQSANPASPALPSRLLASARTIAVVGLSTDPAKPSARVAAYLQRAGYRVIPVHPTADRLLGERVYRSVADIPEAVDLVDVFRPGGEAPEIVRQAIANGARAVWLQLGIVNSEAEALAKAAGVDFVQNRCTAIEHAELRLQAQQAAQQ